MVRRSDHTKDELKQMAINAGYNIIKSQGFNKFSARKVASEIGYTGTDTQEGHPQRRFSGSVRQGGVSLLADTRGQCIKTKERGQS